MTAESTAPLAKYAAMVERLRAHRRVLVAYSGGIDSALVLRAALDALGPDAVLAVTAVSPALARHERDEAAAIARELGARHRFVESNELARPGYVANGPDRCFHCKSELYQILTDLVRSGQTAQLAPPEDGTYESIVNGANVDDLGDHRPGLRAAEAAGVRSPLVEAGLTKADVRAVARHLGLRIWDKPAAPCLSSRIPYNSPVTPEKLGQIERAEAVLRALGFRELRVRHHDRVARLEVPAADMPRLLDEETRTRINAELRAIGFSYVSLDLGGFSSGSLNRDLSTTAAPGDAGTP